MPNRRDIPPEPSGIESRLWTAIGELQDDATETRARVSTPEQMALAVEAGMRRAVSDPAFWAAVAEGLQVHATRQAGGWLIGGISAALSKILLAAVVALGVYLIGGWSALGKLWAALTSHN